jgi:hypothetical protein
LLAHLLHIAKVGFFEFPLSAQILKLFFQLRNFRINFRKPKSSESDTGRQAVSLISNTRAKNIAAAGGRQAASADKRSNGRPSGRLR